jgi:hypothetical protein
MTLMFIHPLLLVLTPVVAVTGWLLLRRSAVPQRLATILDFWPVDLPEHTGRDRWMPDWPWILILAAAVLAALALSEPQLRWPPPPNAVRPAVKIEAVGQSLPGNAGKADIFVKIPGLDPTLPYTLRVRADHPAMPGGGIQRTLTAARLARGIDLAPLPAHQQFTITLKQALSMVARTSVRRLPEVQHIAAHFIGPPPPAMVKLLSLIPGLEFHAGISGPGIWIIHQRDFNPGSLGAIKNSAIVLLGQTPGPQLSPGAGLAINPAQAPISVGKWRLLKAVHPSGVEVRQMFQGHLGPHWHVLMRVGAHAWLAQRHDPAENTTWLWLASPLTTAFTDWPHHASFVIFFSNVINKLKSIAGHTHWGDTWRVVPENHLATINPRTAPGFAGGNALIKGRNGPGGTTPNMGKRVSQRADHLTPRPPPLTPAGQSISLNRFIAMLMCLCLLTAIVALALRDRKSGVKP